MLRRLLLLIIVTTGLLFAALYYHDDATRHHHPAPSSHYHQPPSLLQSVSPRMKSTSVEDIKTIRRRRRRRRTQETGFTTTDDTEETNITDAADDIQLGVSVSFQDVYRTIIFITVAWTLGTLCHKIGLPSLVGEITTGFLLGPPLADFVPFPEAMVLMGTIGLIGLMLESGMNIDVAQLKESGKRAVVMAFIGTTLPLLVGWGLGLWSGEGIQSSISIGASFAPSSFGVAAGALTSGEIINTPIGQMIVASSVVDDVLGLILLAIVEVFTYPNPKAMDFILPFISSFGYLLLLGYSAVTWMPRMIENRIMPLFSEKYREFAAFAMMFFLLIGYMPLLHYSRASSLTGAFLAGLTFSQINSIHLSFVNKGRHLLNWLLRIFFSATIGFQVPVRSFNDPYVLEWGAKFILAILVKMPLGFFVRRYQREIPDDFPYNPYWRDFWITALSVMCRGEFNFIIASFALGAGLISADLYAAIVFAVLIACVIGPLLLSRVIQHYNDLSKAYLTGNHPIHRIGRTCDGYRPLFHSIQARSSVHVGLQDTFRKELENAGLIIIDHRSFHTLGMDAVDITEVFAQDTKMKVRIAQCFDPASAVNSFRSATEAYNNAAVCSFRSATEAYDAALESAKAKDSVAVTEEETTSGFIVNSNECQEIEDRCNEIRQVLIHCLEADDPSTYTVQVSQWKPFSAGNEGADETGRRGDAKSYCLLNSHHNDDIDSGREEGEADDEESAKRRVSWTSSHDASGSVPPEVILHRRKMTEPQLDNLDLWDTDYIAQEKCGQGHYMEPTYSGHYDVKKVLDPGEIGATSGQRHRRRASTASNPFGNDLADEEAELIKERLHGYVRSKSMGEHTPAPQHHRNSSVPNALATFLASPGPPNRRRTLTSSSRHSIKKDDSNKGSNVKE